MKVITETGAVHDSTCGFAKGATKRTNKPYTCKRCAKRNGVDMQGVPVMDAKPAKKVVASKNGVPAKSLKPAKAKADSTALHDLLKAAQDLLIATGFLVASRDSDNTEALDLINKAVRTIADAKTLL